MSTDDTTTTTDPGSGAPNEPAGGEPATVDAGRFDALEREVREFLDLLRGRGDTPPTNAGEPAPSAAAPAGSPASSSDSRSVAEVVRGILDEQDRDFTIAQLRAEVDALKAGAAPPKRGWGAWIVGDRFGL